MGYKMYVWKGVLADYTSGMVCVLAKNKKQALSVLRQECTNAWIECKDLEPKVYNSPVAVYVYGGG